MPSPVILGLRSTSPACLTRRAQKQRPQHGPGLSHLFLGDSTAQSSPLPSQFSCASRSGGPIRPAVPPSDLVIVFFIGVRDAAAAAVSVTAAATRRGGRPADGEEAVTLLLVSAVLLRRGALSLLSKGVDTSVCESVGARASVWLCGAAMIVFLLVYHRFAHE